MFYFQLKKKKKKRDRDFSIISVGRERAIKQVFFLRPKSYGLYSEKNYFWLNFPSKACEVPVVGTIILVCFSYFYLFFL